MKNSQIHNDSSAFKTGVQRARLVLQIDFLNENPLPVGWLCNNIRPKFVEHKFFDKILNNLCHSIPKNNVYFNSIKTAV